MSSIRCAPYLRIEPHPSATLKWFLIANFGGAIFILFTVFSLLLTLPLAALLGYYIYWLYQHHILQRTSQSVRLLTHDTAGIWQLHTFDGITREVTLSPSTYIHPKLIILILLAEGESYTLLLPYDSLPRDSFRALSVLLRMKKQG